MRIATVLDDADTVTVLRANGGLLTKRWTRREGKFQESGYDKAYRFSATEHPVSNVHQLGELICQVSTEVGGGARRDR